jgi:hypothetical protein
MSDTASTTPIQTKPWWQSETILASAATIVFLGLGLAGYQVAPEDQAALLQTVFNAVGMVTSVVAIVGRVKAQKKIG